MNPTFITHPSVRIKSTENNYNPVQCFDVNCPEKTPHMHCPFCVKTESYTDPVILKAHYRVKHVDKGIEFAGLKVLRCCDTCDIVGVIKGEKKFKGAHWHCYKCRNGFNRRDEAIKHYKTHFRNPQTTFQIQIAQEVNQPVTQGYENDEAAASLHTEEFSVQSIHPVLTEAITCASTADEHTGYSQSTNLSVMQRGMEGPGVGAVETVSMADSQTIMIIQDGNNITSLQEASQDPSSDCDSSMYKLDQTHSPQSSVEPALLDLQTRIQTLEKEKAEQQQHIQDLNKKLSEQASQLETYKAREAELIQQLSVPMDKTIHTLLDQLQTQHRDLLQQQLFLLKRSYLQAQSEKLQSLAMSNLPLTSTSSLTGGLNPALDLQAALEGATNQTVLTTMSFQHSDSDVAVSQNSLTQSNVNTEIITVPIVEAGDGVEKFTVSTSEGEQFEILRTSFTHSLEGDSISSMKEDNIPIENCGQEPSSKRRKMKTS